MASPDTPGYSVNLDEGGGGSGFTPPATTPAATPEDGYTPQATADVALPPAPATPSAKRSPTLDPPAAPEPPDAPQSESPVPTGRSPWTWLREHWLFVLIVVVLLIIILILGLKSSCEPCPECDTLTSTQIEQACRSAGESTQTTVQKNNSVLLENQTALAKVAATANATATKDQVHGLAQDASRMQSTLAVIERDARHCQSARTKLTRALTADGDDIEVESTANFPPQGLLAVGLTGELVRYTQKTPTRFLHATRGCTNSLASAHLKGATVLEVDPATGTCGKPPPTLAPLAKSYWFIPTSGHVPGLPTGPIPLHYDTVEVLTNVDPTTNVETTVHNIIGASIFLPPQDTTDVRHGVKWTLPRSVLCEQAAYLPVKFGPLQGNITCMFE